MAAITNNSFIVTVIAVHDDKGLIDYDKSFGTKADAWHYIQAVRSHALANECITSCSVIVFDTAQQTGSIFRPFKEIWRELLMVR